MLPLIAAVAVLAFIFFIAATLLQRGGPRWKKLASVSFLIALTQGLLVSLRPPANGNSAIAPLITVMVWCSLAVILFVDWQKPQLRLVAHAARVSLIFAPLPLVLILQLAACPGLPDQCKEPKWETVSKTQGRSPIIVAIFDEWSFDRTFPNGSIPEWMPNLRQLKRTSTFYPNSVSAGPETFISMPKLLLQTQEELSVKDNQLVPPDGPSLLDRAPEGYKKAVVGFHLPYLSMLSGNLDACETYTGAPRGDSFCSMAACDFLDFLIYWQDPWVESLRQRWYIPGPDKPNWLFGPYWHELGRKCVAGSKKVLQSMPPNTVALFHFPFPHPPMVVNADGSFRKIRFGESDNPEIYRLNLVHVDQTIGELINSLKERHLWDDTLLVIASDHNWREDLVNRIGHGKGYDVEVRRVPLFIKYPHQEEGRTDTNHFEMTKVSEIFPKATEIVPPSSILYDPVRPNILSSSR